MEQLDERSNGSFFCGAAETETAAQSRQRWRDAVLRNPDQPSLWIYPQSISQELAALRKWITWKWVWKANEDDGGKWTKVPLNRAGNPASANDAANWLPFRECVSLAWNAETRRYARGIGFVFTRDDDIIGIDLDDCRDPNSGRIEPWAQEIIGRLQSYAEISPSGTGIKIWLYGDIPAHVSRIIQVPGGGSVEIKCDSGYFTATGWLVTGAPSAVTHNPDALSWLITKLTGWQSAGRRPLPARAPRGAVSAVSPQDRAAELTKIQAALAVLYADLPYDDWIKIGQAIHAFDDSDSGLAIWDTWSSAGKKYVPGEPVQKWRGFSADGGITLGTLYHLADETGEDWRPAPDLLEATGKVEYQPFPVEALPAGMREYVVAAARSIGCDVAYVAIPMLVSFAALIGNTCRLRIKNGWDEPPVLWAAIVGRSGTGKSPAMDLGLKPIQELHQHYMNQNAAEVRQWEQEMELYSRELSRWKRAKGDTRPPIKPEFPHGFRILTSDTTIEALFEQLRWQPRGMLYCSDELAGWFGSFDRYRKSGGGSDLAHWLATHGARQVTLDRKTGNPPRIYIPQAAMCVLGGIQPATLRRRMTPEFRETGLMARFLIAYPPPPKKEWTESELPDERSSAVRHIASRLVSLPFCGPDLNGNPAARLFKLSPEARRIFAAFFNRIANEQFHLDDDLIATWSKLECYAPRIALVLHLVRWAAGGQNSRLAAEVDEASMSAAIALVRWFATEARRIQQLFRSTAGRSKPSDPVEASFEWLMANGGVGTPRDLHRAKRVMFRTCEDAEAAMNELTVRGRAKWEEISTNGRPRRELHIIVPD